MSFTIKKIYLPGTPRFLLHWEQFGEETKHFCTICSILEADPLARKDIRLENHALASHLFGNIL